MKTINAKRSLAGRCKLVLPMLLILFTQVIIDAQAPPNSYFCATDGQVCRFGGEREVIYGANGIFVRKIIKGGSECLPATFGIADPVPNVLKSCYVVVKPVAPGTDLSGPWVMYDDKGVQFDKPAVITQTGTDLSIDNGYGVKSTASLLGGRTFTATDRNTGTVVPDGTRINWNNRVVWIKQSTFGPPPDLNYSWMIFNEKQQPNGKIGKITQDGLSLSVDIGNGTTSNAVIVGSGFKTPDGLTGIPSGDGKNIHWSNGYNWFRLHANPKPEVIPDLSGKWNSYDGQGRLTQSTHTMTQSGKSLSIVERTTQGESTRYSATITRDQFVTNSNQGTILNNATRIEFRFNNNLIGYLLKELPPGERKFPETYGSRQANRPNVPNVPSTSAFPSFNADEMRCVNMTQGHVVFGYDVNSQPVTQWSDQSLSALCRGTKVPMRTIECYVDATNSVDSSEAPIVNPATALTRCNSTNFAPPQPRLGEDPDIVDITPKGFTREEIGTLFNDDPPIDEASMGRVMRWIADQVAAERLPFCWQQTKARGGDVGLLSDGSCPGGYERQGGVFARCKKLCPADFSSRADDFTCYQTCPSNRPQVCSLFGCAKDLDSCRSTLQDQGTAVGSIAVSVFVNVLGKAANLGKAAKLKKAVDTFQSFLENYQKAQTGQTTIRAQIELVEKLAASNFAVITSPEIEAKVDKQFGRIGGYFVKRKYAQLHLGLVTEPHLQASFKNAFTLAGLVDPTGLLDVMNSFYHPQCKSDFPFPSVARHYNY